ncbi:conjugative transposon protein TraN, partial [Paramuribaculum intestinale]
MKTITKFFVAAVALFGLATAANAKTVNNTDNKVSSDTEQAAEHDMNVYGTNYTDGDKFDGLTRKVGFDRMIPPHALEVCYNKTTHI